MVGRNRRHHSPVSPQDPPRFVLKASQLILVGLHNLSPHAPSGQPAFFGAGAAQTEILPNNRASGRGRCSSDKDNRRHVATGQ